MAWSDETKRKARITRKRNRRLREIGELVLEYPLLWREVARDRGYGNLIDRWNGQFKKRKKKPRNGSNSIRHVVLYHLDGRTGEIITKEAINPYKQSLPGHFLQAAYCTFIARSRHGIATEHRVDCSMIEDARHWQQLARSFGRQYPARSGYLVVCAFLRFVVYPILDLHSL